ncbi:Riboflavin synthase [Anatilimnocola aggregata]|uniref:Riboflavin synthase n=2 Tax=Anatilimnocola aggregata TaxID=2528021 RepID=A0A517YJA9_9BACT|nr:Riboflavin synthase [Anatilimnocola aggregata]
MARFRRISFAGSRNREIDSRQLKSPAFASPYAGLARFCYHAGMFTGLVEELGTITAVVPQGAAVELSLHAPLVASDAAIGDSISVNGCCLTVVRREGDVLSFEAGSETLSRTNLGRLHSGSRVNLERSLKVGDRLGGHYVSGHIDALATLDRRLEEGPWAFLWFRVPAELSRQLASKGSVAVDGVSLTLVECMADQFSVALIPHTLAVTTLGQLQPGDAVNIETDLLAKYVQRQLAFVVDR